MFRSVVALALALALIASSVSGILGVAPPQPVAAASSPAPLALKLLGTYTSGLGELSAETVAVDRDRLFITNAASNSLDIVDISSPGMPQLVRRIDLRPHGAGPNSVAVSHGVVAVAVEANPKTDPSVVVIQPWPVKGVYLPDAIAGYRVGNVTYLVTANEGDARDYTGFSEEARIGSLTLDPAVFPNAAGLKQNANLGRLNVTRTLGQGPNGYTGLHPFGARSFSIWRADNGARVWDDGDQLERITAQAYPANFNASNSNNTFDNRSDDKGPESEGVAIGTIDGRTYAFVGLERIGDVMVFDVTNPLAPAFVQYTNNRNFAQNPPDPDSGAEVVHFVPVSASITGRPLVLVSNEVSGTVSIYKAHTGGEAGA